MKTQIAKTPKDLEALIPIAKRWLGECDFGYFGLNAHLEKGLDDLSELVAGTNSDLFMLMDGERPIGLMGIRNFVSPLGDNLIAEEHYMYILPEYRGRGGLIFLKAAKEWAKENMCTHLVMNASTLASKLHDKVCKLYEYMDMDKFETSFICEV
jgi:GNAT superfamily N-acetyltransferase